AGLFEAGSPLHQLLSGVAAIGPQTAPLPARLLGAARPLRAFLGHVEPTFDWTLSHPETNQFLTASLQTALYQNLYRGQPVGLALRNWFERVASLSTQYDQAYQAHQADPSTATANTITPLLLRCRLSEYDVRGLVILGDPTVTLAPMTAPPAIP